MLKKLRKLSDRIMAGLVLVANVGGINPTDYRSKATIDPENIHEVSVATGPYSMNALIFSTGNDVGAPNYIDDEWGFPNSWGIKKKFKAPRSYNAARWNALFSPKFDNTDSIDKRLFEEKIAHGLDGITYIKINNPKEIFDYLKDYSGNKIDRLVMQAHGSSYGLGNEGKWTGVDMQDLSKYPEGAFKHVMSEKGHILLEACLTNERHEAQLTFTEYLAELFDVPVTGATDKPYLHFDGFYGPSEYHYFMDGKKLPMNVLSPEFLKNHKGRIDVEVIWPQKRIDDLNKFAESRPSHEIKGHFTTVYPGNENNLQEELYSKIYGENKPKYLVNGLLFLYGLLFPFTLKNGKKKA